MNKNNQNFNNDTMHIWAKIVGHFEVYSSIGEMLKKLQIKININLIKLDFTDNITWFILSLNMHN